MTALLTTTAALNERRADLLAKIDTASTAIHTASADHTNALSEFA
jgi:hypothetical protein